MPFKDPKEILVKQIVSKLLLKDFMVEEELINKIKSYVDTTYDKYSDSTVLVSSFVNEILYPKQEVSKTPTYFVNIISNYTKKTTKKVEVATFSKYFKNRLKEMRKILSARAELAALTSISRILAKQEKEEVATIGMISDISETKNGNLMLTLEDETAEIKVLINKDKENLKKFGDGLVLDDVIGVSGNSGDKIIFANNVILPEVPHTKEFKKFKEDVHACFLSDIHVGSDVFLGNEFERFLKWIRGEAGDENQKELAKKIKYIFIAGDLVDGVGIYPGQEKDLKVTDIFEQYELCFNYLDKIPKDKAIIICPGNHDAERLAEPQPPIFDYFRKGADFSNFFFVSNPSMVQIHKTGDFDGFNCLLYHGYSFDYYVANVSEIRNNGGYDRADLIMKFLLQRRHLAPSYTSTLYLMDEVEDPLVIKELPDFFLTGHIHRTSVSTYKNITLISGSTWQDMTAFQEKLGHNPEPCRVPIVNLKTREVKILKFS
ncbi:DNA-directed DNA polymerase II small subunit [Candidatus Woesearchaeota archaeon]|nr:DNA-directed DNA polymerase II small subunit [Candidatus Woesearchaeota archaeon]